MQLDEAMTAAQANGTKEYEDFYPKWRKFFAYAAIGILVFGGLWQIYDWIEVAYRTITTPIAPSIDPTLARIAYAKAILTLVAMGLLLGAALVTLLSWKPWQKLKRKETTA
jgi:hypothetical protein